MRQVDYLSPSAISCYQESPTEYYKRYLCENRPEREPQNQPMAIGSAFDAFVKSYLHEKLFGVKEGKYELQTIFEAQVDAKMRDWAYQNGKYVFEQYKQSGVLTDLMELLENSSEPRFEFEVRGAVHGYREGIEGKFGEVTLLGKPDVDFVTKDGVHVILDFKVNGYCANYAKSPAPYYLKMRSAGRTNHGMHAKCRPVLFNGMEVNMACGLEYIDSSWAQQLAIYGWLCGEPVASQFVTVIHQVVCNPTKGGLPSLRFAEHVNLISKSFQQEVFDRAVDLWELVHSDHFFKDMSKEESDSRCELLEGYALAMKDLQ